MNSPAVIDAPSSMIVDDAKAKVLLSIVIPMKNEVGAVKDMLDGCRAAAGAFDSFELCVTDDGSTDETGAALAAWAEDHTDTRVVIITHAQSAGQSAAVHSGVMAATGQFIVTLDGDGQNPPDQIGKTVAPLLAAPEGSPLALVAGQRVKRDDPFAKRAASKLANKLRAALLKDGTRDTGCGLKAFRRDAYLALPYFDHMHRYLPALFPRDGWEVAHVDVTHRPRTSGASKYNNFHRALVGVSDLLGVAWLIRRRKRIPHSNITKNVSGASK